MPDFDRHPPRETVLGQVPGLPINATDKAVNERFPERKENPTPESPVRNRENNHLGGAPFTPHWRLGVGDPPIRNRILLRHTFRAI